MPVKSCQVSGRPGFKWGDSGRCYTYEPGDESSRQRARQRATNQGLAATGGDLEYKDMDDTQKTISEFPKATQTSLRRKAEEHNEKVGSDSKRRTTPNTLAVVYKRGVGAYNTNTSSGQLAFYAERMAK